MIEQFGQFALALRKLILGGGAGSAAVKQQLRSLAQHAGLDLEIAGVATADTLALLLAPGGELEPGRCWMYAETLYLDGLDAELSSESDRACDSYRKARLLFSMVAPLGAFLVGFPEAATRIKEIDRRISELAREDEDDPTGGIVHHRRIRRRRTAGRRGG
ncbi:MAG: hypothetical protein ACRELD_15790 [Longimicrobiales bacterium]